MSQKFLTALDSFSLKIGKKRIFLSLLDKQDEHCTSFQGAKYNVQHSQEYWLGKVE